MEDSIKKYIENKSSNLGEYLTSMYLIQKKTKSPVEKIFYLEWHYKRIFFPDDDYYLFSQFRQKEITGRYIVDFMVSRGLHDPFIAIEIDGHNFHEKTKEQVRKDKARERFITKNVTKFLRFSGSEVFKDPGKAVNEVLSLIEKIEEDEK